MTGKASVLVLGSRGMLGRVVYSYLKGNSIFETWGTHHQPIMPELLFRAENKEKDFQAIIDKLGQPDWIINCIGRLRSLDTSEMGMDQVNTRLPQWLDDVISDKSSRLIHISTDAVFPASAGPVDESSKTKPEDRYGQTKLRGETTSKQAITVRASIIGFDPEHKRGLIEWVKNETHKTIKGYKNQLWAGTTVLEAAIWFEYLMTGTNFETLRAKTAVIHLAPHGPISKYELVKVIARQVRTEPLKVTAAKAPHSVTRYLVTKYKKHLLPPLFSDSMDEALQKLNKFEAKVLKKIV